MAERRMFSKTVIDNDMFLDMPLSAQALYFHLAMRADDDGFVGNPRKIQRMVGSNDDDYKLLIAKQFIIAFESGVIVIKHWRVHNCIRNDRHKETVYINEKACIETTKNGAYSFCSLNDNQPTTNRQPNDNQMSDSWETQDRLGKDRLGKGSIGEDREAVSPLPLPSDEKPSKTSRHKYGLYHNVLLSDEEMEKLRVEFPADYQNRIERLSEYMASTGKSYKNCLATIRNWARRDKEKNQKDLSEDGKWHVNNKSDDDYPY